MSDVLDRILAQSVDELSSTVMFSPESMAVLLLGTSFLEMRNNWIDRSDNPEDTVTDAEWDIIERINGNLAWEIMHPMIGVIMPMVTLAVPQNMLICDGETYLRTNYPLLYAVLDPAFIIDADTFVTPDLRNLVVVGVGTPAIPSTEQDLPITAENNNAWMDGGTTSTNGDLYLQVGNNNSSGFRFVAATIPQGEILTEAILTVYATDEFFDVPSSLLVRGVDKDTTGVWTSSNEPNPNTYTSASASMSTAAWIGDQFRTVNVTAIVQEIIDRAGYVLGNPIALVITNQDGGSDYVALRGWTVNPAQSAVLHLEWGGTPAEGFEVNESGGEESHVLTVPELAEHTHTDSGHTHSYSPPGASILVVAPGEAPVAAINLIPGSTGSGSANIQNTGDSEPHNNMQPYRALRYGVIAR